LSIDLLAELAREARKRKDEAPAPISVPTEEAAKHILIPTLFKETAERGIKRLESMENVIFPVSVSSTEDYDYSNRKSARKFTLKTEKFLQVAFYDSGAQKFETCMICKVTKSFNDFPDLTTKTEESLGVVALDHAELLEVFLAMYPMRPEARTLLDKLGKPEPEPVPQKQGEESHDQEDEEDEDDEDDQEEELVTKDELDSILDDRFEKFLAEEFEDADDEEEIDVDEIKADVRKDLEKKIEQKFDSLVEAASAKAVEKIQAKGVCPQCGKPCGNQYNLEMHVATAHSETPTQRNKGKRKVKK